MSVVGRVRPLPLGTLMMMLVIRVEPDWTIVVRDVKGAGDGGAGLKPGMVDGRVDGAGDTIGGGCPDPGCEEMMGVTTGVWVIRVLKRLGGATLLSHCVLPLITE